MKTIKTAELIGTLLNWAVNKCELGRDPLDYVEARDNYSTSWNKGGPIIERELIEITPDLSDRVVIWFAEIWPDISKPCTARSDGTTPLIAAMRCYVASKLCDEVEIPEELE